MLKIILIVVVVLIAGVLAFAATKPAAFHVERSAVIKAPSEKIFAVLSDFRRWPEWSPWEKLDPAMQRTLSGAASGPGAVYAWAGNSKAGQGRMEITDATPSSRLGIKLDFIKPFEGHNVVVFALAPQGDATQVTWTMDGPSPFISKVMQVFVSMDGLIGKDFAAGLENLKALTEK
jgi:uncharacterized protein YndB with AHSA1/START domain